MATFVSEFGEPVEVFNGLFVAVLEIHGRCVSLGFWDESLRTSNTGPSQRIADVCRNRSTYFWFPKNGACTLVVHAEKGTEVFLVGTERLRVLEVASGAVTFVVMGQSSNFEPNFARTRMQSTRGRYTSGRPHVEPDLGNRARGLRRSRIQNFKEPASG